VPRPVEDDAPPKGQRGVPGPPRSCTHACARERLRSRRRP
jgi:hypothetical protein